MRLGIKSLIETEKNYTIAEKQELYDVFKTKLPLEFILALNLVAKQKIEKKILESVDGVYIYDKNKFDRYRAGTLNEEDKHMKKKTNYLIANGYGVGKKNLLSTIYRNPIIDEKRPFGLNKYGIASFAKKLMQGDDDIVNLYQQLYDDSNNFLMIKDYRASAKHIWSVLYRLDLAGIRKNQFYQEFSNMSISVQNFQGRSNSVTACVINHRESRQGKMI